MQNSRNAKITKDIFMLKYIVLNRCLCLSVCLCCGSGDPFIIDRKTAGIIVQGPCCNGRQAGFVCLFV